MARPSLIYNGSDTNEDRNDYIENLIERVPLLTQKYKPPPVWGSNGHIQTAVYSVMQKRPGLDMSDLDTPGCKSRQSTVLQDGSTVHYDVFQPRSIGTREVDVTLAVCPGLASTSEQLYIKAFVSQAIQHGYRVVVLNHLGMLEDVKLTTPRVFNLGSTEEYGAVITETVRSYPHTKLIAVGFSLGGGLVCKYLGEKEEHQNPFIGCISLCQGYDCISVKRTLEKNKMKRFYGQQLTHKVRYCLTKNWEELRLHPALIQAERELHEQRSEKKESEKRNSFRRTKGFRKRMSRAMTSLSLKRMAEGEQSHSSLQQYQTGSIGSQSMTGISATTSNDDIITGSDEVSSLSTDITIPPDDIITSPNDNTGNQDENNSSITSSSAPPSEGPSEKQVKSPLLRKIMKARYMDELDQLVTIKLTGHRTIEDYYEWASSCHYLDNIDIPLLLVNSKDDPLFSKCLLTSANQRAKSHRDTLFVLTENGGHLGFFTKTGRASVDPHTWLEKMTLQYISALVDQTMRKQQESKADLKTAGTAVTNHTNMSTDLETEENLTSTSKLCRKSQNHLEQDVNCNINLPPSNDEQTESRDNAQAVES